MDAFHVWESPFNAREGTLGERAVLGWFQRNKLKSVTGPVRATHLELFTEPDGLLSSRFVLIRYDTNKHVFCHDARSPNRYHLWYAMEYDHVRQLVILHLLCTFAHDYRWGGREPQTRNNAMVNTRPAPRARTDAAIRKGGWRRQQGGSPVLRVRRLPGPEAVRLLPVAGRASAGWQGAAVGGAGQEAAGCPQPPAAVRQVRLGRVCCRGGTYIRAAIACRWICDLGYMSRKNRRFGTDKFVAKQTEVFIRVTHVNGCNQPSA